ncbi:hypothetical protein [Telluribacter sp. SYSU D00476]|uniref:hypothetical protein n=1 Tax=Telluribacter sp. SYSU D00476 TaxID=2811430 RepID=UPI001FF2C439|nr:hypothetical protein [Telluribacter sp. SYSU D00476]
MSRSSWAEEAQEEEDNYPYAWLQSNEQNTEETTGTYKKKISRGRPVLIHR